jgi:hypothetical protein
VEIEYPLSEYLCTVLQNYRRIDDDNEGFATAFGARVASCALRRLLWRQTRRNLCLSVLVAVTLVHVVTVRRQCYTYGAIYSYVALLTLSYR